MWNQDKVSSWKALLLKMFDCLVFNHPHYLSDYAFFIFRKVKSTMKRSTIWDFSALELMKLLPLTNEKLHNMKLHTFIEKYFINSNFKTLHKVCGNIQFREHIYTHKVFPEWIIVEYTAQAEHAVSKSACFGLNCLG